MSCDSDKKTSIPATGSETPKVEQPNVAAGNKSETGTKNGSSTLRTANDKPKTANSSNIKTNYNTEGIPDACDLLSAETIAKFVGQPAETIFPADGSSPQNPKARACFFKWDGSALANAGVMVQLQKNPVQEDVPEYFTYLIASKKTEGEVNPASGEAMKYEDWPDFGDDGAYSTEAGKYVWRIGNDWAFMVAFNTVLPPKSQKKAAVAFAKEVMSNMPLK